MATTGGRGCACPILTALMVRVQRDLGSAFGTKIVFVSITVDPERDTPDALRQYAERTRRLDACRSLSGWTAELEGSCTARPVGISPVDGCPSQALNLD